MTVSHSFFDSSAESRLAINRSDQSGLLSENQVNGNGDQNQNDEDHIDLPTPDQTDDDGYSENCESVVQSETEKSSSMEARARSAKVQVSLEKMRHGGQCDHNGSEEVQEASLAARHSMVF